MRTLIMISAFALLLVLLWHIGEAFTLLLVIAGIGLAATGLVLLLGVIDEDNFW